MKRILGLEGVSKSFDGPLGHERLEILHDIDLEIGEGESISVTGRSGSGKSTLLYVASLIEKPSAGRVFYDDVDTVDWDDRRIAALRRDRMGFVFQNSLLLDDFSALENVMLPLLNKGLPKAEAHRQAACMLIQMGLGDRLDHRPMMLSGGERQRVAIARAVCPRPSILFADEPTGALDEESQSLVEDLLFSLVEEHGIALMLVTHDRTFADRCSRVLTLSHKELSR